MTRNAFNARTEDRHEFPKLEAEHGEDPARFLQSGKDLAFARIAGIREPELLAAYRAVAKQILEGGSQTEVLEAIADRERELTGDAPEPDTADPVPATDGGQTVTPDDDEDDVDDESSGDDLHPDTKGLVAGEVLILETADRTEYIFPATADADAPYLMRAFDGDDERTDAPIALSFGEVAKRLDGEHDPRPQSEIDVQPPATAATNAGDAE